MKCSLNKECEFSINRYLHIWESTLSNPDKITELSFREKEWIHDTMEQTFIWS